MNLRVSLNIPIGKDNATLYKEVVWGQKVLLGFIYYLIKSQTKSVY